MLTGERSYATARSLAACRLMASAATSRIADHAPPRDTIAIQAARECRSHRHSGCAVEAIRRQAEKDLVTEAHRHPMSQVLETCPGLGPIRVAQMLPIVVSPGRTARGDMIVMRYADDCAPRRRGKEADMAA